MDKSTTKRGYTSLWSAKVASSDSVAVAERVTPERLREMSGDVSARIASNNVKHASEVRPYGRQTGKRQRNDHVKL